MNSSDKKFLIGYANKYYPISDYLCDLKDEYERCRLIITKNFLKKEIEKRKLILAKAEHRLRRIYQSNPSGMIKYYDQYISISKFINKYDSYSS